MNTDPDYSVAVEDTNNTDTTYSDTDLNPNTVYAYRVSAINSIGESESSRSIAVRTPDSTDVSNNSAEDTETPTDVVAKVISSTSVELSWTPPTQTFDQTIPSNKNLHQTYMMKLLVLLVQLPSTRYLT